MQGPDLGVCSKNHRFWAGRESLADGRCGARCRDHSFMDLAVHQVVRW